MSPLDRANEIYAKAGANFTDDLAFYLRNGYVFSDPEHLLMGATIKLPNASNLVRPGEADAWYVRLAVGQGALRWFIEHTPFPLPFLAWHRTLKNSTGALHVWPSDRVSGRIKPY